MVPHLVAEMIQWLPSMSGMPANTHSAAGVGGMRTPDLASLIPTLRRPVHVISPERDDLVLSEAGPQPDPRGVSLQLQDHVEARRFLSEPASGLLTQ